MTSRIWLYLRREPDVRGPEAVLAPTERQSLKGAPGSGRRQTSRIVRWAGLLLSLVGVLIAAAPNAAVGHSAHTHVLAPSTGDAHRPWTASSRARAGCSAGEACERAFVDTTPPTITVTPMSGTGTFGTSLSVTIDWCDDHTLSTATRSITLNGTAASFSYATSSKTGCGAHATSAATINLVPGENILHTEMCDNSGNCGAADTYYTRLIIDSSTVTLDNVSVTASTGSDAVQYFTVRNTNPDALTYSLSGRCSGAGLVTTICTATPTSITVLANQSAMFKVTYRTGAAGGTSGRVAGIAQMSGATDSGWANVNVPAVYAVSVTPRGTATVVPPSSSSSQSFSVTNTGNVTATYNFAPNCNGALLSAGSCSVAPTSAAIAAGASTSVTVSFNTATGGTGSIALSAKHAGTPTMASDSGWVAVTTAAPLATVGLARAFPGTTTEKGGCLHFAVRAGVGSECGVLRVAHALPAVRTLNKARVPTLVYYYDQAGTSQVIGVNVTRLSTASVPDSVRAILYQKNTDGSFTELQRRTWPGSFWSATGTQRVALTMDNLAGGTSRIVPYRVQVDFKPAGQGWAAAAPPVDGELAIVRREMAPGWNVAGVEALYPQSTSTVLWVGGDGSTRKYVLRDSLNGKRIFTAPALDRPDTLLQTIVDNSFTREAGDKLQVIFNASGLHTKTINRLGHETSFAYVSGTRKLQSITVPPATAGLTYQFSYDANGALASVTAPGSSAPRVVTIAPGSAPGVIARITDPDSSHVDFEYLSSPGGGLFMSAFTDRRGTRTTLTAEASAPTLGSTSTTAGAQTIAQSFRTPSSIGAATGTAPTPIDSVYARYDGPRTDVADVLKIWLGDFDVPTKVVGPIGETTTVAYGDARFPLLATRVTRPEGMVSAAAYDSRGNVVADTVYNPLGDGRNAVTTYAWDSVFDLATQIVSPTGIVTERSYDPATGNLLWAQTGGVAHRDSLTYFDTSAGVAAKLLHWTKSPTADSSEVRYDAIRGNARLSKTAIGYLSLSYSDAIGRDTLTITPLDTALKNSSGVFVDIRDSAGVVQTGTRVRTHYNLADRVTDQWTENGPGVSTYQIAAETLQVHTDYDAGGLTLAVKRRALPDTNAVGWITDSWAYDAFGRDTLAPYLAKRYDLAGNVVWTSHGDSSVYDARGMRTKHLLPAVHWLRRDATWYMEEPDSAAADSEVYAYGTEGELLRADNRYATIRRGYFPNGALRADTTTVVAYTNSSGPGPANTPLAYEYDLEGRRTKMHHALISGADSVQYAYDPITGALQQVTDPQGNAFTYAEDVSGRLSSLAFPGMTESYRYDRDSRLRWINGDSLQRDARGKVVWKSNGTTNGTVGASYSALGNLVQYSRGPGVEDYHRPDAFGNPGAVDISGTNGGVNGPFTDGSWKKIFNNRGAIDSQTRYREDDPYIATWQPDGAWSYDSFGNVFDAMAFGYAMRQVVANCGTVLNCYEPEVDTTNAYSYYDANNRLRYTVATTKQHYWSGDSVRIKTWEYRYDALGLNRPGMSGDSGS